MDFKRLMNLVFLFAISQCLYCCFGHKFSVGGRDGWIVHPSEDYSHWSNRNRFLVNDTLFFKYKEGEDSVLEVKKDDYYNCNTSNWVLKNENGSSVFKLDRSGPFFFISGVKEHCDNGQKLLLIVLSEKHSRAASPAAHPPAVAPTSVSLSPSLPPLVSSPTTTTKAHSPALLSSPPKVSPVPAISQVSSPGPTVQPALAPPPGSPSEDISPVPEPVPSQKAAASAMNSALPVLASLMVCSNLFLRAIM
ncbi:hypothetical protein V2J09_007715 [Rumex salicifolius]